MVNELASKLYDYSCNLIEKELKDGVEYNKVCEIINNSYKEIEKLLPEDKIKLIKDFDFNVNRRDCMVSEATYIKGFKDGTKLILELLK